MSRRPSAKGTDTEYDYADDAAEAKKVREVIRNSKEIAAVWADMLSEAAENYRRQGKAETKAPDKAADNRLSIRSDIVDINGKEYDNVVMLDAPITSRELGDSGLFAKYLARNLYDKKSPFWTRTGMRRSLNLPVKKSV